MILESLPPPGLVVLLLLARRISADAAQVALFVAATAVPGARLVKRRHWSIH